MTVIANNLAFAGATGKISRGGKREYTAQYRVTTDDKQDQPFTIHEYFLAQSGLPHPDKATSYSYGNDSDTQAICDSLSPRRDADSPYEWLVSAHFGDAQSTEKGEDENGDPTDNPLDFAVLVNHRNKATRKPLLKATYVEGFGPVTDALVSGFAQPTMIVNSAIVPYDPPQEQDYYTLILVITKNVADPLQGIQVMSAMRYININPFTVNHPSYNLTVPPLHAKIVGVSPDRQRTNGISYWRMTTEIEVDFDEDWRLRLLDRGILVRRRPGDPNGQGGTVSATDINAGDPLVGVGVDKIGHPITEPQLLDGEGQFLGEGKDPVFSTWKVYTEFPIEQLTWLSGVLV